MKSLVGSGDDLGFSCIFGSRISCKTDFDIRIDGKDIGFNPSTLSKYHSYFTIGKSCFLSRKVCFQRFCIAVFFCKVKECKVVVIQFRIIGYFSFSFFKLGNQVCCGDAGTVSCCIDETLVGVFEYPPFSKTGGEWFETCCCQLITSIF